MSMPWKEYIRVLMHERMVKKSKNLLNREDGYINPAILMLEKKKEVADVEEALQLKKEEFKMKMEALKNRREALVQNEDKLKDSVIGFNKFLKETEEKQNRAWRQAEEMRLNNAEMTKEIDALRKELEGLIRRKQKLEQQLQDNRPFFQFLVKVVAQSEEFQEIPEMITRYKGLCEIQAILSDREKSLNKALESGKAKLRKIVEEKNDQLMYLNNHLSDLQKRLKEVKAKTVQWESKWTQIQNTAAEKTLLLGQIRMASLNLYNIVSKQIDIPDLDEEDTEGQLDQVQAYIQDFSFVFSLSLRGDKRHTALNQ